MASVPPLDDLRSAGVAELDLSPLRRQVREVAPPPSALEGADPSLDGQRDRVRSKGGLGDAWVFR